MYRTNLPPKNKKSRLLLISVAAAILLVAGLSAYLIFRPKPAANPQPNTPAQARETIKYAPATDQEKADSEARKNDIVKNNESTTPPPTTSSGKTGVTPIVASATKSRISAYVPGIIEDDGTCTTTITNTGTSEKIVKTSQSIGNSSYTTCEPVSPNLGSGTWTVTVSYSSAKAEGTSKSVPVEER